MRWEKVELGKISKVISGFPFKSKDFKLSGTPVIKIKNIKDENIVLNESDCVDSAIEVPLRFHLNKGDILISLTGSHITLPSSVVGRVAKYRHDTISYLNQRAGKFINIDNERCFEDYLFYFLLQKQTLTKIANKAQGAANQANISPGDVEGVEIYLPPLSTQRKIASILSGYDDLIENNLKRIKLLEEKAFCEYKLMADFQKTVTLGDILKLNYGKSLSADNRKPGTHPVYGSSGVVGFNENSLVKGPGVIVGRKGNVGTVFWSQYDFFPIDTVYYIESEISLFFLYFNLKHSQHFDNSDAAVPGLNRTSALGNKIHLPSLDVIKEFEEYCKPIFSLMNVLQKQNTKLREARDILLPKLMNGQIEV